MQGRVFASLLLIACTGGIAAGQATAPSGAAGATAPTAQPPYTVLRYNEDYSYLRDPALRTDFFDPIKYIPLDAQGDWYLSLGGQIRDRYEYFHNNLFGAGPQDRDGYNLLRVMANADVHLGQNVRVFLQGISASVQGINGGPRPTDANDVDLHQGFVDLKIPFDEQTSFTLRSGRQNLLFGAQRLIGPLDWANVRRTFDGFRGTLALPGNDLDLFFVQPVRVAKDRFDTDAPSAQFMGVYDTWHLPGVPSSAHAQLELYGLYLQQKNVTFPTEGTGREQRYTLGGRLSANPKPFDFDVEPDFQFGNFNGGNIDAFSFASEAGYTFSDTAFSPRPFLGFDIASGDRHPGDGHLGTFNQLFPTGHLYFGYIDAIGRQNIIDLHPGVDLTLLKNHHFVQSLTLRGEYHEFWRESDHDAVYTAGGTVLRPPGASSAASIGGEADVLLNWQIDRHLNSYFGYSHFFAGRFIDQTGPHKDIDFLYAALTYTF